MNDVSFLNNNIELLKGKLPYLAEEIMASELPDNRRALDTQKGFPVYQVLRDSTWINLTSSYDPYREAERQVVEHDVETATFLFVLGEGGLYHAEVALQRASEDTRVFIVGQSASNLRLIFETRDLTSLLTDDRVVWLVASDIQDLSRAFHRVVVQDQFRIPTFCVLGHPVELQVEPHFYTEIQASLINVFRTRMFNYYTTGYFEKWWAKNFVSNMPFLRFTNHIRDFKNSWSSRPAIVVGAGPSLNKNVHLLHKLKHKALIICVGTAYRILHHHGIEPDLIVSLDGGPINASHFEHLNFDNIPLLMDVYCHRDIVRGHAGPKIAFASQETHAPWWGLLTDDEPLDVFPTGGSAATCAFYFARFIDANPVIMIGEDLSYPEGQRYAKGARYENDTLKDITRQLYEVTDIYGNTVYTSGDYLFYLRTLEEESLKGDRTYINATEGGALRRGFVIKTLAECLEEYCNEPLPVEDWQRRARRTCDIDINAVSRIRQNTFRSKRELKAMARSLFLVIERCNKAIEALEQGGGQMETQFASLFIEKMLTKSKRFPYATAFLDACSFSTVVTDINLNEAVSDTSNVSDIDNAKMRILQSLRLFTSLYQTALDALESHDEGVRSLQIITAQVEEGKGLDEYKLPNSLSTSEC